MSSIVKMFVNDLLQIAGANHTENISDLIAPIEGERLAEYIYGKYSDVLNVNTDLKVFEKRFKEINSQYWQAYGDDRGLKSSIDKQNGLIYLAILGVGLIE